MTWDSILFSVCVGSLIAGIILTVLLIVLSTGNLLSQAADSGDGAPEMDSDASGDSVDGEVEVDADGDLSADVGDGDGSAGLDAADSAEIDMEGGDTEGGISSELDQAAEGSDLHTDAHTPDTGEILSVSGSGGFSEMKLTGPELLSSVNQTPSSLVFSFYLLLFGAIGTGTYDALMNKYLWLGILVICPIGLTKVLSVFWRRVAKNYSYRVRVGKEILGRMATVKIDVSADGGVVSLVNADNVQQFSVRALNPLAWFYPGDEVYICDYRDGVYYVDVHADNVKLSH